MSKKPKRGRGVNRSFYKEQNATPGKVKSTIFMETKDHLPAEPVLTFAEFTTDCDKCGGPIGFKKLSNGKWCPISIDGGDHWDECREWQAQGTYGILNLHKRINHIGPVITPGHGTAKHRKKIGLNPADTSIPFDPPYVVNSCSS